jgi:hypothetical protein
MSRTQEASRRETNRLRYNLDVREPPAGGDRDRRKGLEMGKQKHDSGRKKLEKVKKAKREAAKGKRDSKDRKGRGR